MRRVGTKSPSRSGALVSLAGFLPSSAGSYTMWIVQKAEKRKKKSWHNLSLTFSKVSVSTRTYYTGSVYRLVDSKANSSGPLNKSVPNYNASTSIFSSDTWQFNLKSNWSCLCTSANTVWGGWTIYWFRLIFLRSIRDRYGIRCHTRYILHSAKPSIGDEAGFNSTWR